MTDHPPIHEALAAVMDDVGAIAKTERNPDQNFSFRGIDSILNAVGPVLRKHGVVVAPEAGEPISTEYATRSGTRMRNILLPVEWTFYGPRGDSISCRTWGEAADAGDKAMTKAQSVAFRVALLQTLAIPTHDLDPDAESHERAADQPHPEPVAAEDYDPLVERLKDWPEENREALKRAAAEAGLPRNLYVAKAQWPTVLALVASWAPEGDAPEEAATDYATAMAEAEDLVSEAMHEDDNG